MSLFKQTPFKHDHVLRFITAFGDLFSGITITKQTEAGDRIQSYEVPLEYAPKNKWISRLREQNDLTANQVKMTVPRAAFEMVDIRYAPDRKIGVNGQYVVGDIGGVRGKIYPPAPYDMIFELNVLTKDQNDSLQVLEQIVPYFQPYMTINYEILPAYRITKDVPITLTGYKTEDTFEGSPEDTRTVTTVFTFAAQMDFFGPMILNSAIIKTAIVNMGYQYGKPTNIKIEENVNPTTAGLNDNYTIVETISEIV